MGCPGRGTGTLAEVSGMHRGLCRDRDRNRNFGPGCGASADAARGFVRGVVIISYIKTRAPIYRAEVHDEMSENQVVVRKLIKAEREEVYEAFTEPHIMSSWFYPFDRGRVEVTNTLKVGGAYSIVMIESGGGKYEHTGEYKELSAPERLVFTWNSDFAQGTVVTVTLAEVEGGTEVTVTHDFLTTEKMREDHRKGWTGCLNNLDKLFA